MPDNPFSSSYHAILDPNQGGTIMGAVGGLLGAPTAGQAQGSATGQALQELSALKDQGMNNQQALLKFFQSPTGHEFFTNAGPDGLKKLVDGLSATTPPSPTMNNIPPGGMLTATTPTGGTSIAASNPQQFPNQVLGPQDMQVNGKGDVLASNPNQKAGEVPADVKSFNYFAQVSGLPPAEIKRLAGIKIDPSQADKATASTQAIDKLVSDYGLDPHLGEALKAGQVKVLPLKNEVGQDTGAMSIVDLTGQNGPTVQVINPGGKGPAATTAGPALPAPAPGTTPANGASTGTLPPADTSTPVGPKASAIPGANPKYFGTKSSMFLASGPIATGLQAASGASEMVSPSMIIPEGAQAADRQTMIDTLRSDLAAMGQLGGGIGVNKGVLEGYLKLAPTGGLTESPHQAIQKAIRLSEHIQQEIEAESQVYGNAKLPLEERKSAQARIQGWQRVQRDLPSDTELGTMEKAIREGTAGAPTISGAANTIVKAGSKALTEVKKEVGTVAKDQGLGSTGINIDAINDPKELLAIDPKSLSRDDKIKYLRKIDTITKGKRSDSGSFQVAGDVVPLHPAGTFARNTQGGDVINGVAERLGIKPPNNVTPFRRS